LELFPEEAHKVSFPAYRSRLSDLFPKIKHVVYESNTWGTFFTKALERLDWSDYKALIRELLKSDDQTLVLVVLDFIQLPAPIGIEYNDVWYKLFVEYKTEVDKLNKKLKEFSDRYQKEYEENCRQFKQEYFSILKKNNELFEQGLLSNDEYISRNDKAHMIFVTLCTEEYQKMTNKLGVIERDIIEQKYTLWARIRDELREWLLTNLL